MDANFGLVHKSNSGVSVNGPVLANRVFYPQDLVDSYLNNYSLEQKKSDQVHLYLICLVKTCAPTRSLHYAASVHLKSIHQYIQKPRIIRSLVYWHIILALNVMLKPRPKITYFCPFYIKFTHQISYLLTVLTFLFTFYSIPPC